ncbi:hypothetical protein FOH24_14140 [Acetobacter tropicalis]|jgi:hypothetical protein|uniref:hypothetical protein n=1 Tax=Acetobacter tropicalis TaxID=104102 RepID=UPI00123A34E8|nr:hypothetical protein [Acetobacter tropicalis]KAA8385506.1 hypothetical protein FOH22_13195 [Acetobacter tropicalis]KAA8387165.1 hypothetical protein FOH24_14140 [Acetobacter tropicalis]MBC9007887.1 hypothetical protein [Acetobacter tropicalis]
MLFPHSGPHQRSFVPSPHTKFFETKNQEGTHKNGEKNKHPPENITHPKTPTPQQITAKIPAGERLSKT